MGIDGIGMLRDFDIGKVASFLDCDIRSVYAASQKLASYGYICFSNGKEPGKLYNILISNYSQTFAKANEGGRGYLFMSLDTLKELSSIRDINVLRIVLRMLCEMDNHSVDENFTNVIVKTYKQLQETLPYYVKKNLILESVEKVSNFFKVSSLDNGKLEFSLVPERNDKQNKERALLECEGKILNLVNGFNSLISSPSFSVSLLESTFPLFVRKDQLKYHYLELKNTDIKDLALVALTHSPALVIDSISTIYKNYTLLHRKVDSWGALTRTIVRSKIESNYEIEQNVHDKKCSNIYISNAA